MFWVIIRYRGNTWVALACSSTSSTAPGGGGGVVVTPKPTGGEEGGVGVVGVVVVLLLGRVLLLLLWVVVAWVGVTGLTVVGVGNHHCGVVVLVVGRPRLGGQMGWGHERYASGWWFTRAHMRWGGGLLLHLLLLLVIGLLCGLMLWGVLLVLRALGCGPVEGGEGCRNEPIRVGVWGGGVVVSRS